MSIFFLNIIIQNALALDALEVRLSTGDSVSVEVFDEPELSVSNKTISEWGTIELPLLGSVELKGKTVNEAQAHITSLYLADYLKNPQVALTVNQFRPIFVDGAVKQPGAYPYVEGLTVEAAIRAAGGLLIESHSASITLLTESSLTGPVETDVDRGILPGDVISVN